MVRSFSMFRRNVDRRTKRTRAHTLKQIKFILLISRQGKTRLAKWYIPIPRKEQERYKREVGTKVLMRARKLCNFLEYKEHKVVYKRYASLYFVVGTDMEDNELITLEMIHHFVEILDRYFGSVCELDIIFNFHKAYYIVDEIFMNGMIQETSKKRVLNACAVQDEMMEDGGNAKSSKSKMPF